NRNAKRRTRHVVELGGMAERDRGWVAAVLAADAHLKLRPGLAPALDTDADQRAHALLIDRDERIARQNATRSVDAEEARRIVAADSERGLRQVIGAEREEFRALGDLVGEQRRARQLDHGADLI